ncbi:hypothetical protein B0H17DRAFT_1127652 [Mycena rosella]|uniref:Uncharacterized protein n=1 Tax=Mycena rosella TaxID=1033263 RepID=A0AAD7DYJ2_MYCRO|nr:hypothetical protein B0H17DRAFT_1127652 [Mycena rosella]
MHLWKRKVSKIKCTTITDAMSQPNAGRYNHELAIGDKGIRGLITQKTITMIVQSMIVTQADLRLYAVAIRFTIIRSQALIGAREFFPDLVMWLEQVNAAGQLTSDGSDLAIDSLAAADYFAHANSAQFHYAELAYIKQRLAYHPARLVDLTPRAHRTRSPRLFSFNNLWDTMDI